jgi:hypothetical protein
MPNLAAAYAEQNIWPAMPAVEEMVTSFEFVDNYKGSRTGRQRLFPVATVLAGNRSPPGRRRSAERD